MDDALEIIMYTEKKNDTIKITALTGICNEKVLCFHSRNRRDCVNFIKVQTHELKFGRTRKLCKNLRLWAVSLLLENPKGKTEGKDSAK